VKAAREFNPHQRIPEFPNSREVGPVQRTIYPAEYSRIDRITLGQLNLGSSRAPRGKRNAVATDQQG